MIMWRGWGKQNKTKSSGKVPGRQWVRSCLKLQKKCGIQRPNGNKQHHEHTTHSPGKMQQSKKCITQNPKMPSHWFQVPKQAFLWKNNSFEKKCSTFLWASGFFKIQLNLRSKICKMKIFFSKCKQIHKCKEMQLAFNQMFINKDHMRKCTPVQSVQKPKKATSATFGHSDPEKEEEQFERKK